MKRDANEKELTTVLNVRDMPLALMGRVKAAAAFEHTSLKAYVTMVLEEHVTELEKKGLLPKSKG